MKGLIGIALLSCVAAGVIPASEAWAQSQQGQGGQSGGGRSQPPSQPNQPSTSPDEPARPIFLSGSVRLTDGTVPPERVLIERSCNGQVRPEGYTDSQGNFSFLISGQPGPVLGDASTSMSLPFPALSSSDTGRLGNSIPRDLSGCEIQGRLDGFLSSSIVLTHRTPLDNPNIGIIHLQPLGKVDSLTLSVTTAAAPKDARNAYEKGLNDAKKEKWSDAEQDFLKAVQVYPRYAIAWYELGRIYRQEKKLDDAARAQSEAVTIDPKFISPYSELTVLAVGQAKWEDVVSYSSKVIRLTPNPTSAIYFYSAVAHYNLKKIDIAEDHARQAASLDPQHKIPRINHLLGLILAQQRKYDEATENLKLYLKLAPNAPEVTEVNQLLDDIDKATTAPAKP